MGRVADIAGFVTATLLIAVCVGMPLHVGFVRWAVAAPPLSTVDPPVNACEATGIIVQDGDTIRAAYVALPWGVSLRDESVRAFSYDAWEISRQRWSNTSDVEIKRGKEARDFLQTLAGKGRFFLVQRGRSRDSFGRLLADFYVLLPSGEAVNVGSSMKDRGFIRHD